MDRTIRTVLNTVICLGLFIATTAFSKTKGSELWLPLGSDSESIVFVDYNSISPREGGAEFSIKRKFNTPFKDKVYGNLIYSTISPVSIECSNRVTYQRGEVRGFSQDNSPYNQPIDRDTAPKYIGPEVIFNQVALFACFLEANNFPLPEINRDLEDWESVNSSVTDSKLMISRKSAMLQNGWLIIRTQVSWLSGKKVLNNETISRADGVKAVNCATMNSGVIVMAGYDDSNTVRLSNFSAVTDKTKTEVDAQAKVYQQICADGIRRAPRECIRDMSSGDDLDLLNRAWMTSGNILEAAESRRRGICENLIRTEAKSNPSSLVNNCVVTNRDLVKVAYDPVQKESLIKKCASELSSKDIVENNDAYSKRFKEVSSKETAKRIQVEQQKTAIESAKKTPKNFEIKGLNLRLNKSMVVTSGANSWWKCSPANVASAERCEIYFAEKSCWQEELGVNKLGMPIMVPRCKIGYYDIDKLTPELKRITTVGGSKVFKVTAIYSGGNVAEYRFLMERISSDLEVGIKEKYGDPVVVTATTKEWIGLDEELFLILDESEIVLRKPSAYKLILDADKQRVSADKINSEIKQKQISEQKRKDL